MDKNSCGAPKCKYHFGDECFRTQKDVEKFASPNVDGQAKIVDEANPTLFEMLCLAVEVYPDRHLFPADNPDMFVRNLRGGNGTGEGLHYGWQPVWSTEPGEHNNIRFAYRFLFQANPVRANKLNHLRDLIQHQMSDVRTGCDGLHVHHEPPFIEVVENWLASEGLTLETLIVNRVGGQRQLPSIELTDSWVVYHAHNTTLTVMTEAEHWERHREMKRGE